MSHFRNVDSSFEKFPASSGFLWKIVLDVSENKRKFGLAYWKGFLIPDVCELVTGNFLWAFSASNRTSIGEICSKIGFREKENRIWI